MNYVVTALATYVVISCTKGVITLGYAGFGDAPVAQVGERMPMYRVRVYAAALGSVPTFGPLLSAIIPLSHSVCISCFIFSCSKNNKSMKRPPKYFLKYFALY